MTQATVKQKRNDEQLFLLFMSSFYFSLFLCLALWCTIILPPNHLLQTHLFDSILHFLSPLSLSLQVHKAISLILNITRIN